MSATTAPKPIYDVLVNFADNHFGKVNKYAETGVPDYNTPIAQDCVRKVFVALEGVTRDLRRQGRLGKLVVNQLGDGTEGSNMRPGQALNIDRSVGEQKDDFVAAHTAFARDAQKLGYESVDEIFTGDNHGRIGRRLDDDKTCDTHTYDAAQRLATALEPHGIHVRVPVREWRYYRLRNFDHYTEHGHRMAGGGKTHPAQKAQQHIRERRDLLGIRPHYAHFAHFHTYYLADLTCGTTVFGSPAMPVGDHFICNVLNLGAGGAQLILPQHETEGIVEPRLVKLFPARGDFQVEVL